MHFVTANDSQVLKKIAASNYREYKFKAVPIPEIFTVSAKHYHYPICVDQHRQC